MGTGKHFGLTPMWQGAPEVNLNEKKHIWSTDRKTPEEDVRESFGILGEPISACLFRLTIMAKLFIQFSCPGVPRR